MILVARGDLSSSKVYGAPANTLSSAFYNLYEVPVSDLSNEGSEGWEALLSGASVAFLETASAFLRLANLGSEPATGDPIPRADTSAPKAPPKQLTLMLNLSEERLEGLQNRPNQKLTLDVENGSDEKLPNVDLSLDVISENTAHPHTRYYQETVEKLAPGDMPTIEFEIDLSSLGSTENREEPLKIEPQENRKILEVKATTPDDDSAVKTAVLAP